MNDYVVRIAARERDSRVPRRAHLRTLGVDKTYHRVAMQYYWPGMYQTIAKYVRSCATCHRVKFPPKKPLRLMSSRIVEEPWQMVVANIMGAYSPTRKQHQYLLVIQDYLNKWVIARPLLQANCKTIARRIEDSVINQ